jgi:hypothetical protein
MSIPMRRFGGAVALLAMLLFGLPAVASAGGDQTSVTYTIRQASLAPVPDRGEAPPDFIVGNSPLFDRRNRRGSDWRQSSAPSQPQTAHLIAFRRCT